MLEYRIGFTKENRVYVVLDSVIIVGTRLISAVVVDKKEG